MFCEKDLDWAKEMFAKIDTKMEKTIERTMGTIPYFIEDGKFENVAETNVGFWTNGFYGGLLWIMYERTKNEKYRIAAEDQEKTLDGAFENFFRLDHDIGFMWHLTTVLNYKLTNNEKARMKGMYAASVLSARFNIDARFIRAWQHNNGDDLGWSIIDTMMNLGMLYWASEQSNDPRFARVAKAHADKSLKHHIRPDGSVKHIVAYDPETGEELEEQAGQGYAVGSAWTRGQAWAIYGYAITYNHTKDVKYLDAAKSVANYFITAVAQHGWVPPCDFRSPLEPVYHDCSAGAIAACGMLEIAKALGPIEGKYYANAAISMLRAMEEKFVNWNPDEDGILHYGTVRYHLKKIPEHNRYIVYSDFYFVEAFTKILGSDLQVW